MKQIDSRVPSIGYDGHVCGANAWLWGCLHDLERIISTLGSDGSVVPQELVGMLHIFKETLSISLNPFHFSSGNLLP